MSKTIALDRMLTGTTKVWGVKSVHERYAERSQLMRWFNERSDKELKAMRKGFELMLSQSKKGGKA